MIHRKCASTVAKTKPCHSGAGRTIARKGKRAAWSERPFTCGIYEGEMFATRQSFEVRPVGQENAIARVAVARNLNEGDSQLLGLHVQLLAQYFGDAFHRPAFLLYGAPCQHRDLYVRHGDLRWDLVHHRGTEDTEEKRKLTPPCSLCLCGETFVRLRPFLALAQ